MTRQELVEQLLVERFGTRPPRPAPRPRRLVDHTAAVGVPVDPFAAEHVATLAAALGEHLQVVA